MYALWLSRHFCATSEVRATDKVAERGRLAFHTTNDREKVESERSTAWIRTIGAGIQLLVAERVGHNRVAIRGQLPLSNN